MCGIVGYLNFKKIDFDNSKFIRELGEMQFHRGPDEWGEYIDDYVSLGHNRLSILDIELGKQPMFSSNKNSLIIFNGEIYNFQELKDQLLENGVIFNSKHSDTETIVNGIDFYGTEFIKKLDGMFSFCYYNVKQSKIILSRDRIGIKPLYYYNENGHFVFASEIKTIIKYLRENRISLDFQEDLIPQYFHFRSLPTPNTFIKHIKKVVPGSFIEFEIGEKKVSESIFYSPQVLLDKSNKGENLEKLEFVLKESIKKHLISDVKLGIFLSGGIDSSLIAKFSSEFDGNINAFTIKSESNLDESKYASIVSDKLNIDLNIKLINGKDMSNEFQFWSYVNDDPVSDPSALALMLLTKFAKEKGLKVMLSGEGADELFGGYYSYFKYMLKLKIKSIPFINIWLNKKFPALQDYDHFGGFLGTSHLANKTVIRDLLHINDRNIKWDDYYQNYSKIKNVSYLRSALMADQFCRLPNDILARTDRATMAYSIEARVPFLSNELIEFGNNLDDSHIISLINVVGKKNLKLLALKFFDKKFVYRKKNGFELPIKSWIENDFKENIDSYLKESRISTINYNYVRILLKNMKELSIIWAWIQLESWYRTHILDEQNYYKSEFKNLYNL